MLTGGPTKTKLRNRSMAESLFRANPNLPSLARRYQTRAQRAIERIWVALQRWAIKWAERASGVTPVGVQRGGPNNKHGLPGRLKHSYFVVPVRNGDHFTIILANHMQYGRWLEFGTRYIAHGHVLAWKQGDPPVMNWPAKAANLQQPSARASEKTHARWSARLERAMTPGQGEQMPMVRPTGYELVPQIIEDVKRIVREEFGKAA